MGSEKRIVLPKLDSEYRRKTAHSNFTPHILKEALGCRERQLTASLEREAALEVKLAETERALEIAVAHMYEHQDVAYWLEQARAELKEKP